MPGPVARLRGAGRGAAAPGQRGRLPAAGAPRRGRRRGGRAGGPAAARGVPRGGRRAMRESSGARRAARVIARFGLFLAVVLIW